MTAHIAIDWTHGRPQNGADQDEARAIQAAERVLDAAGADYAAAYDEYQRQWVELDDEDRMTGLARVWIEAARAADVALTDGWSDPTGAGCTICAWNR